MNFIVGLPETLKGYTVIWIIVDRLTESAHSYLGKSHIQLITGHNCVRKIVRLHRVPISIVSDQDPRSTSAF